ncbi:MAG: hypothetical protein R3211_05070 [Balneolaceae bacterium]|nr:hypothetical protein [Balneolaceae bacterium]
MKIAASFLLLFCSLTDNARTQPSVIDSTRYFTVHSHYWINLHHFLYQEAKGSQQKHLQDDGYALLEIGEDSVYNHLTAEEAATMEKAVEYYREHLIDRSLLRMNDLRVGLQQQDPETPVGGADFSAPFQEALNGASPVYRRHFWPLHDARNRRVYNRHKKMIKIMEESVVDELERVSGDRWPDSRVRIDLTAYANFAGAYTVDDPRPNSVISTLDPFSGTTLFIETLFHEGTHLLFIRSSPFRARIYTMSEEMGMEFPGYLWHICQFYLTGRIVQDLLEQQDIEHKLLMDVKKIYGTTADREFRSILETYYRGNASMDETIRQLLLKIK